ARVGPLRGQNAEQQEPAGQVRPRRGEPSTLRDTQRDRPAPELRCSLWQGHLHDFDRLGAATQADRSRALARVATTATAVCATQVSGEIELDGGTMFQPEPRYAHPVCDVRPPGHVRSAGDATELSHHLTD